jgi:hypothetical protein
MYCKAASGVRISFALDAGEVKKHVLKLSKHMNGVIKFVALVAKIAGINALTNTRISSITKTTLNMEWHVNHVARNIVAVMMMFVSEITKCLLANFCMGHILLMTVGIVVPHRMKIFLV